VLQLEPVVLVEETDEFRVDQKGGGGVDAVAAPIVQAGGLGERHHALCGRRRRKLGENLLYLRLTIQAVDDDQVIDVGVGLLLNGTDATGQIGVAGGGGDDGDGVLGEHEVRDGDSNATLNTQRSTLKFKVER